MYNLDEADKTILEELQKNCRQSTRELGRKLKMPATTVHQRIRKLVETGIIKGFSAIVDHYKVGMPTTAFVLVRRVPRPFSKRDRIKPKNIGDSLAQLPEVEEAHVVTGEWDVILKVRGANEREIGSWVVDTLWNAPEVGRTLTFFSFYEAKDTNAVWLK